MRCPYEKSYLLKYSFQYRPMKPALRNLLESSKTLLLSQDDNKDRTRGFAKGKIYQQYKAAGAPFLPLVLFSDGAATAKLSSAGIWVAQYHVPSVTGKIRPTLSTIWYKSSRKYAESWKEPKKFGQALLRPLINELKQLEDAGLEFHWNGTLRRTVIRVLCWTSDSQERWKLLQMSSFLTKFGCVHCAASGQRIPINDADHRTVQCYPLETETNLLDNVLPLRNVAGVDANGLLAETAPADADRNDHLLGVQGTSILSELLYFNRVLQVPQEPIHLCFEGLEKNFMEYRKSGPIWKPSPAQKTSLNQYILAVQPHSEFSRTRPFAQAGHWKAAEYMAFTLYYGLPALYGITEKSDFLCYAKFATVCQILFDPFITEDNLPETWKLALTFALELQDVATRRKMSYNLHQFSCHLVEYVYQLGHPTLFWAFEHEDFIGKLKKQLKGTNDPAKELAGKAALFEAARKLERKYLRHSANPTARAAQTSLTNGLRVNKRTVSGGTAIHRFFGKAQSLATVKNNHPELAIPTDAAMETNFPGAPEVTVTGYDRCLCAKNISVDSIHYQRKVQHVDSAFADANGNIYLACKFFVMETGDEEKTFVAAHRTTRKEWNYFGFSEDLLLSDVRFQQHYRNLRVEDKIELFPLEIVSLKAFLMNDQEGNRLGVLVTGFVPC